MLKLNKKIYKILVIGGAGFIGFHLVKKLYSKGYVITVFDNLSNPSRDYKKNPFPVIKGDVLSKKNSLAKIITTLNPNFIIDLAAYHYIPLCIKNPVKTRNVNVVGTKNILNSIRKFSPNTHLIYSSSAAIYAPSTHPHQVSSRIKPIDIYGQTKEEAEKEIQLNSKTFGTKYTILRLFNVYGSGDNTPHLIPEIIKQIKKSTIRLGNKNTCRDYIYVDDVVNGIIHVIKNQNVSVNKTFNLGTGKSYSAKEIIAILQKIMPTSKKIEIISEKNKYRQSDRPQLVADISKSVELLNWVPRINLKAGLKIILKKEGLL